MGYINLYSTGMTLKLLIYEGISMPESRERLIGSDIIGQYTAVVQILASAFSVIQKCWKNQRNQKIEKNLSLLILSQFTL